MLEAKNLTKIYKPKRGVPVRALDGVNIRFPDRGMVFLLGKSGSGKSTLLNVLGGLDQYDEGEITIGGTSSKDFKQSDFDSYRNTFVGFIFQEYNVLDEFSVGANIALSLQLQGKKATDEEINRILEQVDLAGFGDRKPNELSGGQKQRVAIARALVKNPHIIMADEPTGALDSKTGRQVLDTLKALSGDKLVIIVSHDREFAEQYADRIIELSDGKVISDMTYEAAAPAQEMHFAGSRVQIPCGYHLSEEDRERINAYIDALDAGVTMELQTSGRAAKPTDPAQLPEHKSGTLALIRSKLPMKWAFKIGAGGLKYKKLRLVITVLLSCISFGLFGLSDTFGAYNHIKTCVKSIEDTGIGYAAVDKSVMNTKYDYYVGGYTLSEKDLQTIKEEGGVEMIGVYCPADRDLDFTTQYNNDAQFTKSQYHIYPYAFNGFAEIDQAYLDRTGFTLLAGELPEGESQIAVSEYICQTFMIGGYRATDSGAFQKIESTADMVGKSLVLGGKRYKISGVIDTKFNIDRYKSLVEEKLSPTRTEELIDMVLQSELSAARDFSMAQVAMVGKGVLAEELAKIQTTYTIQMAYINMTAGEESFSPDRLALADQLASDAVTWLDGQKTVGENEVLLPRSAYERLEKSFTDGKREVELYSYIGEKDQQYMGKVVGVLEDGKYPSLQSCAVIGGKDIRTLCTQADGLYRYAVGAMPESHADKTKLVSFCYRESDVRYGLQNSVTYELDTVDELLKALADVFFWIGIGFALFAALMLANFIGTSIAYKKQEIGILRAIGSRGNDVFRIFFSESFLIAMINFVLSSVGVGIAIFVINYTIRYRLGVLVTVLHFGVRQIGLLLVLSVAIAFIASFLPVRRIATKRPIDAIRNK